MIQSFAFELKQLSEQGRFTGLASTYGSEDLVGDTIERGAFTRTLEAGNERPLLLQHREAVGTVKLFDSPAGLIAEGTLSLGVQAARDSYVLLKDRALRALSIGFSVVKEHAAGGKRRLQEIRLWEVSLVPVGANPDALITQVKSLDEVRSALASLSSELDRALQGRNSWN